jgi:hypothetical protein
MLDLRRRMGEIHKALDRNEPVAIFYRGRQRGVLYPARGAERKKLRIADSAAFGMWKDRRELKDVDTAMRRTRRGRVHNL